MNQAQRHLTVSLIEFTTESDTQAVAMVSQGRSQPLKISLLDGAKAMEPLEETETVKLDPG